ncbi:MAG TPA: hypothetical protein VEW71_08585 [Allosphingosinicella sp.]|nr:hypothetical protein [Allosphingosinicella sp.]
MMRNRVALLALCLVACGQSEPPGTDANLPRPAAARAAPAPKPEALGRALDMDCSHVGQGRSRGGYQFISTCPGRAVAPNGRWAVVKRGGEGQERSGQVSLTDPRARDLDELRSLSDGMPFVLYWSPRSDWFFANHYLGSSLDRLRVFQIVNRVAIERSAVFAEATRVIVERYPCLGRGAMVVASGWRWSRDGRRIAIVVHARPDACQDPPGNISGSIGWQVLWMIGDVESGRIDPASVRVRPEGVGPMPTDGPYAAL